MTDEQIAKEGLDQMEAYMRECGLVMSIKDLGVTEDMLEGIADLGALEELKNDNYN